MDTNTLGDGLGRRRRRKHKGMGALPTLVGRKRKGGKRKGRKICIRTSTGKKVCGTRWRRKRRK